MLAALPHPAPAEQPPQPATFCNPLPIPNYPVGKLARQAEKGKPDSHDHWQLGYQEQFRELADPSALWFEGKWYLYPSVDMAWVSADRGGTWQHHPLNVRDTGYAPTVVHHRGRFLLLASGSPLHAADSPLGPFQELGRIRIAPVPGMPGFTDPMLFSDEDGRLFYYWGCSASGGIWGAELDAADPCQPLTAPAELIPFQPATQPWEAVGEWNQDPSRGWMEGSWLLKRNGTYYLTYSAAGTQHRTYAMGCCVAKSPLGPYTPQQRNPILRTTDGLVTGTAHGCIVAGPDDELWAFYTVRACVVHMFERRIGMDRASIDEHGELMVHGATSLPQWLPGQVPAGARAPSPGWLPLNSEVRTIGSSNAPNLNGRLATDNDLRTWWQPAEDDPRPTLTSHFMAPASVRAIRVIWRDVGLDTPRGVLPGPFRYLVETETAPGQWSPVVDRRSSREDLLIDYRECPPTTGTAARLTVFGWPKGILPAVAEFTVFGEPLRNP